MLGIGVIGYGYWGPNLVRNFVESPKTRVVAVSDLSGERLASLAQRFPSIATTSSPDEIYKNPAVDAVVIATPVSTHFELGMAALRAGKHLLVEKPLATSYGEAMRLVDEAAKRGLTLMVDHTFVFSGAVQKIHQLVSSGDLGKIQYYDSVRINLGLFQRDVNVIWDLAVHDLAILDYVLPTKPYAVSATGIGHIPGRPENIAYVTLFFENNVIAHIHTNWLAPVKVRRTLIGGSRKMVVYDDVEPSEKVKIYDSGITYGSDKDSLYQLMIGYRTGDMVAPRIETTEALKQVADHFATSILNGTAPITDGETGVRVVRLLEAATHSMSLQGRPVELSPLVLAA